MEELRGKSFGSVLSYFRRREKGLTQEKLAKRLEVHENSVSLWERELGLPESHSVVLKIAELLHLNEEERHLLLEARYGTASILPLYNVPFERNPYFTGREELLQQLHEQLTTKKQIALKQAISGIGGVGKTQTALEYIYLYRESYHDIFWVDASSFETVTSSYITLAGLLHLPEKDWQDQKLIVAAVKHWLSIHKRWLLILDNIEDLSLVGSFVPQSRQGAILLTTQRQVTEPVAHAIELSMMSDEEGALFLLRRTHLLRLGGFLDEPTQDNTTSAKMLSHELGGLPLALDQAGAYILETGCTLSDYLNLYRKRRAELLRRRGSIPTDHAESVTTTFSLAFERVAQKHSAAPELLRFCAFLAPDAIPEELIIKGRHYLGPVLQTFSVDEFELNRIIEALRTFSLVYRNTAKRTLSVHRLVQSVLIDAMPESMRKQWREYIARALNEAFPEVEFKEWMRCERLLPHVLVYTTWIEHEPASIIEVSDMFRKAGLYLEERGQYSEAESLLVLAHSIRERLLGAGHPEVGRYLNYLAGLYNQQEKYKEAEQLSQRVLTIYKRSLGDKHPDTAGILGNLAGLDTHQRKYKQAERLYHQALAILGDEHPDKAACLHGLANLYWELEKYEQAEPLYQQALTIDEQLLGAEHPGTALSLNNLAGLYNMQGKSKQAEQLYKRALMIREQCLGEHPDTAVSLNNLALFYHEQRMYEQAEPLYQRALKISEQYLGEHSITAVSLHGLADISKYQGKYKQAEALYQRALRILEHQLGPAHPMTQAARENYAAFLRMVGRSK